jgi:hypothetical protein
VLVTCKVFAMDIFCVVILQAVIHVMCIFYKFYRKGGFFLKCASFYEFCKTLDDGRVSRPKHVVVNIMNIRYLTNSAVSLRHCNGSDRTRNITGFWYFKFQAYLTSRDYIKLLYWKSASIFNSNLVFFHHKMSSFTVDYTLHKPTKTCFASGIL